MCHWHHTVIMSEVRHFVCSAVRYHYARISPDRASENRIIHELISSTTKVTWVIASTASVLSACLSLMHWQMQCTASEVT